MDSLSYPANIFVVKRSIMDITISARLSWKPSPDDLFLKGKYSRVHQWESAGGQQILASASPHIVPPPFSNADVIDPEEAFVLSIASCHMLFFLSIASKRKMEVLEYQDHPTGILEKDDTGRISMTSVTLNPTLKLNKATDQEILSEIHHLAHEKCFIANSIKTTVTIKIQ